MYGRKLRGRAASLLTSTMAGILQPLIRSNVALLTQKVALLDLLVARHGGEAAAAKFSSICPIVGASVGQHYRHSMDHVELAALVASSAQGQGDATVGELHYDLRVRGGTLEKDLDLSRQRILDVRDVFTSLKVDEDAVTTRPVTAFFNLSGDSDAEIGLPSTIGREFGFAAHHSIHHLAMVKVIALHTLGIEEDELPDGFGRAPSTLLFDKKQD